MNTSANKRAAAILRVSASKQKDGVSPQVQRAEVESYCKQSGLILTEEFIFDITESAKDTHHRKQYQKAMGKILSEEVYNIVFYMSDREARNFTDSEKNESLIKAGVIAIHYVKDCKVLHRESPDADFLMKDFQTLQHKHFIRTLTLKVNDAMRQKAEMGWYPSNNPPLGYKTYYPLGRKKNCIIIEDPNSKVIAQVRREFELRSKGLSFDAIRKVVVDEGLISFDKISAYRPSAIEYRIKNPFYRGIFFWQGKTYKGLHPIIVPKATLDAVDEKIGKRGTFAVTPNNHGIFGRGWLKCADSSCGCHIVYDPKKKVNLKAGTHRDYHFYHCSNGKRVHLSMKGMNVTEENIYGQFGQAFDSISIDQDFAQQIADALNKNEKKAFARIEGEAEAHRAALKQLERNEDEAYEDFKKAFLNEEAYKRRLEKIREQRGYFSELLKQANISVTQAALENAKSILELANQAKSLWLEMSPIERRNLLDTILSNPRLNGPTLEYDLKKPFGIIMKMRGNGDWLAYLDDFRTACLGWAA